MNFFREIANLIGVPQVYRHISKNMYKLYMEVIASPPETRASTTQQHTYFWYIQKSYCTLFKLQQLPLHLDEQIELISGPYSTDTDIVWPNMFEIKVMLLLILLQYINTQKYPDCSSLYPQLGKVGWHQKPWG